MGMSQFKNNNVYSILITKLYLYPATRSSSSLNYPNNIWICFSEDSPTRIHVRCNIAVFLRYLPNTNLCKKRYIRLKLYLKH